MLTIMDNMGMVKHTYRIDEFLYRVIYLMAFILSGLYTMEKTTSLRLVIDN